MYTYIYTYHHKLHLNVTNSIISNSTMLSICTLYLSIHTFSKCAHLLHPVHKHSLPLYTHILSVHTLVCMERICVYREVECAYAKTQGQPEGHLCGTDTHTRTHTHRHTHTRPVASAATAPSANETRRHTNETQNVTNSPAKCHELIISKLYLQNTGSIWAPYTHTHSLSLSLSRDQSPPPLLRRPHMRPENAQKRPGNTQKKLELSHGGRATSVETRLVENAAAPALLSKSPKRDVGNPTRAFVRCVCVCACV